MRLLIVCGLFAGLIAGSASTPSAVQSDLAGAIQTKLAEVREKAGFPGITAAVVMPDGRVIAAAAGWSDASHLAPLTTAARMPAGSVGKTFVAAVILLAVDDGTLDLDSPIERWLGREPWFARLPNAHALTLRLLLSHRGGVPEPYDNEAFLKAITTDPERQRQVEEVLAFVFDKKPRSRAGTKYFYTDANYVIAGAVFERATGKTLFGEISRRILGPQGLVDTVPQDQKDWRDVVPGVIDPRSPLYFAARPAGESMRGGRFVYNVQMEYAGGGIISTAPDLARWARALWGGAVLGAPRLAEMLDGKPSEGKNLYGLATEITQSGAGPVYGHDGWIPGYVSETIYVRDLKLAAAVQVNSDPMKRYRLQPGDCLGQIASLAAKEIRVR